MLKEERVPASQCQMDDDDKVKGSRLSQVDVESRINLPKKVCSLSKVLITEAKVLSSDL